MRLLNVDSLTFKVFSDTNRPPYVIASHRWADDDEETTFQDVRDRCNIATEGYRKVEAFAKYVRENVSPVRWLWIDTCCINKDSAAELSEAINSMFEWYHSAEICLAYLTDVKTAEISDSFAGSEWFERGWTLQELLAPRLVLFLTKNWQVLGHKGHFRPGDCRLYIGSDLTVRLAQITHIPEQVLHNYNASRVISHDEKIKWMEGRKTTRQEDMSYALYGILGVTLGANYGEKFDGARQRLLAAIHQRDTLAAQRADDFRKITHWLSPSDPWMNHESARQSHEPQTGAWLLEHRQYIAWKTGSTKLLWLYGKAGCGKTVLCSTAIEDVRDHCQNSERVTQAMFYFSFSDNSKQTCQNLLCSLVAQLGWKEPGASMLRQAYEKPDRRLPRANELLQMLLRSTSQDDRVLVHLDGLDECPERDEVRQNVLEPIKKILKLSPNIQVLLTSRDTTDIRYCMETTGADIIPIADQTVDADIQKYVSTQISRDRKLSRLDEHTKALVRDRLAQKADGMFRWVYCQLQELKKSKSTRPNSVKSALLSLPATLDDTYERMLNSIAASDRLYALTLLRWLAYAETPLNLNELAEAAIVDPTAAEKEVDRENRGNIEDVLDILSGLVTISGTAKGEKQRLEPRGWKGADLSTDVSIDERVHHDVEPSTTVRLAHFSIKEYLESERILNSRAKAFHLESKIEHRFLAQSCLAYVSFYSSSDNKSATKQDFAKFPLLKYSAKSWYHHAKLQQPGDLGREMLLLGAETTRRDWFAAHEADDFWKKSVVKVRTSGSGLYYASWLGLGDVVQALLNAGAEVNADSGKYGTALNAASENGHAHVVQMLLKTGADVNAQRQHRNALYWASLRGHDGVVQMLLEAGAELVPHGSRFSDALYEATYQGHEKVVQLLVNAGAEVNAMQDRKANPLQDPNANVLVVASRRGHENVVRILLDAGANVNAFGEYFDTALQVASANGFETVVRMLLNAGADVNAQNGGWRHRPSLRQVSRDYLEDMMRISKDAGANLDVTVLFGTALQQAASAGHEKVVQILIDAGAEVDAVGEAGTALQLAAHDGHDKVVQVLIAGGADVNAVQNATALQKAAFEGHKQVVKVLLGAGANLKVQARYFHWSQELDRHQRRYGTALQAASDKGHKEVVQILEAADAVFHKSHRLSANRSLVPCHIRSTASFASQVARGGGRSLRSMAMPQEERSIDPTRTISFCRGERARSV